MAAAKRKAKASKPTKKALKQRAMVAERLAGDKFAASRVESLSRKRGAFKSAPEEIGGDVSRVAAQLTAQFEQFFAAMKSVPADAAAMFDNMAGEVFAAAQQRTPVDTGAARAGWQITNLSPSDTERLHRISNNQRHAIYLEYGWSRQAPAGMLRVSLLEGEARLKEATAAYAR